MCGIFAAVVSNDTEIDISTVTELLKHRGPDSFNSMIINTENQKVVLVHTRLKIVGDDSTQPLTDGKVYIAMNGEIFNWRELSEELNYTCEKSDCEILLPLYHKYKNDIGTFFDKIDGQFAFFLFDTETNKVLVGRDHVGVCPLYTGKFEQNMFFASEMKAILPFTESVDIFQPRHYIYESIDALDFTQQVYLDFQKYATSYGETSLLKARTNINRLLINSVDKQLRDLLVPEAPDFGVLLSGGLDSSLIASLVSAKIKVKTFSIGISHDSADLIAARRVAKYLGTEHYEYTFTVEEGIKAIEDVIWYTETYDTTTIRAGTPMYLLAQKIKIDFPDLKVLFSGELSDELLCYLYGANAPDYEAFQQETIHLVNNVHQFDCLRANKTCMANSIEVRVPFTDRQFVEYILNLDPKLKAFGKLNPKNMEKQILRDSFAGYLPNDILYRKKEQFSDGVSDFNNNVNWIQEIQKYCDSVDLTSDLTDLKYLQPKTKEQLYFRNIFRKFYDSQSSELTVKFWEPKWSVSKDPSARLYAHSHF